MSHVVMSTKARSNTGQTNIFQLSLMDHIMKNKIFLYTAVFGLALTSASSLAADEGFYAGIIGGANWVDRSDHHFHGDNNAGYLVGCDFGYTWCNDFSVEGEFVYRHNDIDHVKRHGKKWGQAPQVVDGAKGGKHHKHHKGHGDLRSYALMANVRYDVPIDCCFTPYVKGGIGWARTKFHANNHKSCWDYQDWKHHDRSKSGFAYQVGVGIAFPVWDCTILDLGYNFLRAQKEINNNSFVAALRYMF